MTQTQEHNVPALRFSEFSGEWDSLKLGDIATFSKGKGISKADIVENGVLECVRYGQLYTDYGETIAEIKSRTNVPANELVLSEANDIIIPASGETQIDIATASCVLKDGVALGGDLNIVKTRNDGVFLSYYLNSKRKIDIARLSQGISVVHLYATQLKTLHLNLPEVPEQQKIAAFLSSVDRRIAQLGQKQALLQRYKKGMMQKLFSQELRFKDAQGDDFPDWEEKRLGELGKVIRGASPRPKGDPRYYGGNIPRLMVQDVTRDGKYVTPNIDFLTEEGAKKSRPCKAGTLTIVCSGTVGVPSILAVDACIHDGFLALIEIIESAEIDFLYVFLSRLQEKLDAAATHGGIFVNLTTTILKEFPISLPSLPEQQKIADFLSSIDRKIDLVSTELDHAKTFKKGLLQQMFI